MVQKHLSADAILAKRRFLFEIIELLKEMLLKQINWFTVRVNQLFLYKAKLRLITVELVKL